MLIYFFLHWGTRETPVSTGAATTCITIQMRRGLWILHKRALPLVAKCVSDVHVKSVLQPAQLRQGVTLAPLK